MPTYPVIHKETGEQKDVKLSVHEWDQWKEDNPDWQRDWSDPPLALNLERLETGRINSFKKILDGMMFCVRQDKHQDL